MLCICPSDRVFTAGVHGHHVQRIAPRPRFTRNDRTGGSLPIVASSRFRPSATARAASRLATCWASACTRWAASMGQSSATSEIKLRGSAPQGPGQCWSHLQMSETAPAFRGHVPAGRYSSSIARDRQTRWRASRAGARLDPSVQATGRILLGMDEDLRCQVP